MEGEGTTNYHCVPGGSGTFWARRNPSWRINTADTDRAQKRLLSLQNVFGANLELRATGVECVGCTAHNHTHGTETEGTRAVGKLRFTGVVVGGTFGTKCTVVSDSKEEVRVVETEALQFTTKVATSLVIEPENGTTIATFKIIKVPGVKCNLVGTHTVTGDAKLSLSGATGTVNVTKASETVELDGEPAPLEDETTIEAGCALRLP